MTSPLSICLSSAYFPPHLGGVEVYTRSIAHQLAVCGCEVTVVTCGMGPHVACEMLEDGVEVLRMPATDPLGRYPLLTFTPTAQQQWSLLEEQPFDAIVVNTRFYTLSLRMLQLARKKRVRPILIEHGSGYLTFGNRMLDASLHLYENATAYLVRRASPLCYGVSREAGIWLGHFGLQAQGVIHNSIDAPAFRGQSSGRDFRRELGIPDNVCIVAFTGRLIPEKGIGVLEETARLLEGENYAFLVAGDGPELARLREADSGNLKVLGRLGRSDVAALLESADVFCFPSSYPEGLPTSLLEAAACEAFIVSFPVGGVSEILPDDRYGIVLPEPTAHACADALRRAFADPVGMRTCAKRCRERVEREFSWLKAADDVLLACGEAAVPIACPSSGRQHSTSGSVRRS